MRFDVNRAVGGHPLGDAIHEIENEHAVEICHPDGERRDPMRPSLKRPCRRRDAISFRRHHELFPGD